MSKLKSFMFDLGNTSTGPVGMVVRVQARTKKEALKIIKDKLWEGLDDSQGIDLEISDPRIEYARIYVDPDNITLADICDGETENVESVESRP